MTADPSPVRHPAFTGWAQVEGFCDHGTRRPGDRVPLRVSSRSDRFSVEVSRIGADRVPVWRRDDIPGRPHPVPDDAWAAGCDWPVTLAIDTEPSWPSGFYEVRLRATGAPIGAEPEGPGGHHGGTVDGDRVDRTASEAYFVLGAHPGEANRADRPLLVLGTNTWQAYNQWGGRCLYSGADRVSFARPLERGYLRRPSAPDEVDFDGRIASAGPQPDPEHLRLQAYQTAGSWPLWTASAGWHNWERRFVRWAERSGRSPAFAVDTDFDDPDRAADLLAHHRLAVTVGHDEYWTWNRRDAMDTWVDGGGNWAIFSGNTCFWQVRYDDGGRTMVAHKGGARSADPVRGTERGHLLTSMWSDPEIGRPETSTIGLTFTRGGYHRVGRAVPDGTGAFTVHRPDHWAFSDTGIEAGDALGLGAFAVGYEVDGCALELGPDGHPRATGADGAPESLEVLATAPARLISITDDTCEAPEALWASVDPPGDLEGTAMVLFGSAWRDRIGELAQGHAVIGTFRRGRGTVFNAGSADWAYGLDGDAGIRQVTANVLDRLGRPGS